MCHLKTSFYCTVFYGFYFIDMTSLEMGNLRRIAQRATCRLLCAVSTECRLIDMLFYILQYIHIGEQKCNIQFIVCIFCDTGKLCTFLFFVTLFVCWPAVIYFEDIFIPVTKGVGKDGTQLCFFKIEDLRK